MKLSEIVTLALKKAECQVNLTNENIAKGAINTAYLNDLSKIDKRLSNAFLIPINGMATLPDDLVEIEIIKPDLIAGEKILGNSLITDRTNNFTIIYSQIREPLVNDTDEPDLKLSLHYALAVYAASQLTLNDKNSQLSNNLMQEYQLLLKNNMGNTSSSITKPLKSNYWDIVGTVPTKLF